MKTKRFLTRLSALLCLLMTTVTGAAQTVNENYERALAAIEDGQGYRVFTMYGGQKYYVTADGYLSVNVKDAPMFNFIKVTGEEYGYGFKLRNVSTYFTNPEERSEAALTKGHLNTTSENARDTWEAQVFFLNEEGKYAIRTTNARSSENPTDWGWVGSAFWTVNAGTDGPRAEYSFDMNYVWQLEEVDELQDNLERAVASIEHGQRYRIFTIFGNKKYYVTADGYLSKNRGDAPLFQFNKIAGQAYSYGFQLKNGNTYFTNPEERNEAALTRGHLNTTSENSRNTFEAQVFFRNMEGRYAIRATNAQSSTDHSSWAWIGSAFWTVNTGMDGPLAEYSWDMNYVWQLELDTDELLVNGQCDGSFDGWERTDGGNGWVVKTDGNVSWWQSSYEVCTLSQTVDLADYGITGERIDNGEVMCDASADILANYTKNGKGSTVCEVTVQMLDATGNVLGTQTVVNDTGIFMEWTTFSTEFQLATGTRQLKYVVKGQDVVYWVDPAGPCFKNLSIKAIGAASDDITSNYLRALNTIEHGECYRVFTMYNGQKYYVTADGHLSTNVNDAPAFEFVKVAGEEYDYGFKLKNGDTYFTNPAELSEEALTNGHLNTTTNDSRNTWEAQVFFLNTQGKYAIRSTNSSSSDDHTSWGWVGSAFWTVNEGPKAEYSWDMNYVWQLETVTYPVWLGSKQVTSRNKNDVLGDGMVRYTPGEGKGTLTFTTSTPTIDGVHSWSEVLSDGREYQFSSKIYAEGIDLTVNAPTGLTLSATGEEYGIYVGNEGDLTINGNFSMTAGGSAICVDKGDLTINGNFNSTTSKVGITVREGDLRVTGDVYVKTTGQVLSSIVLNDGYVYLGPSTWKIESATGVIHAEKKDAPNGGGGIVIPFTHEFYNPENPQLEAHLSDDNRGIFVWDGNCGNTTCHHVIIRKKENWIEPSNTIDLSTLTEDCVVPDNTRITGTLNGFYKVSIADGATVSFRDVNINIDPSGYDEVWDTQYRWAGITCEGNATIFLENTNTVKGFCNEFPGIYVPEGKTLLIYGSGTLNAISGGNPDPNSNYSLIATGIGGGFNLSCGNIIINEGTITATGGDYSAGIGSGWSYDGNPVSCGNITINGGTVTATSEHGGAGIGSGTDYNGTSTCGDITITGGTVTATGGLYGAGIGSGFAFYASSGCGDITISGGTVTATSGMDAAAIGTGFSNHDVSSYCGDITITNGIEKVVATTDYNFVGEGMQGTCGNVTFGDNLGYDAKKLDDRHYICTIQAADKITYPVWIGETQVTYLNKDDILGDGKVSYTPDYTGGTLAFTGTPAISGYHEYARIYAKDYDLTINFPKDGLTLNSEHDGIHIEGNKELVINGDVTLTSTSSTIINGNGNVTVNDKLTLNSTSNGAWIDGDFTINGEVEIEQAYIGINADNVIVKGSLNAQNNKNRGIHANGNVTIDGDIIAKATGGSEPVAIYCLGDITMVSGEVYLTGDAAALQAKGTITIPVTSRVITPWNGQVKKMGNFSYIFAEEGTNPATEVSIRLKDCDVNHDGSVTIADALCIVNHVLGNTPNDFDWNRYELNGDHIITIADAVVVVEMILSGLAK